MGSLVSGGVGAFRPALLAGAGLLAFLYAGALGASLPGEWDEVEAYRVAPLCEVPPDGRPPDCVERLPATIDRTEVKGNPWARAGEVHYRLDDGEPRLVEVERISEAFEAFEALEPGKRVLAVGWGPFIARVELLDGRAMETGESPFASRARTLSLALMMFAVGSGALVMGIRGRRDTGSWWLPARPVPGRVGLWPVVMSTLGVLLAMVFAADGVYDIGGLVLRAVVGASAGGFLGTALYLWRRSSAGAASSR